MYSDNTKFWKKHNAKFWMNLKCNLEDNNIVRLRLKEKRAFQGIDVIFHFSMLLKVAIPLINKMIYKMTYSIRYGKTIPNDNSRQ